MFIRERKNFNRCHISTAQYHPMAVNLNQHQESHQAKVSNWLEEAKLSGNSLDPLDAEWVDPPKVGFKNDDTSNTWNISIILRHLIQTL